MTTQREVAARVVAELKRHGHIAAFAGGCVRDEIMGREPKDFDIATSALPDEVEAIFARCITVGKAFGVVKVRSEGHEVEVATLRDDGQYSDGRRPDSVRFVTSLREDAARRDFTVNAMFMDPTTGEIFDFFGGRADIAAGAIRAVGNPHDRIKEDRLRMLRALRFASRYDFTIDPELLRAIAEDARELSAVTDQLVVENGELKGKRVVSFERIRDELKGILTSAHPLTGLDLLMATGLMQEILPEVVAMAGPDGEQSPRWHPEGNVWVHTRLVVQHLVGGSFELMLGGLLHDVGKPRTFQRHADGSVSNHKHAEIGAEMAGDICRRLRMSNDQTHRVVELVRLHMQMHGVCELRRSKLVALLERPDISDLVALQHADATGTGRADRESGSRKQFLKSKLQELAAAGQKALPLVTGDMLIAMGFKPGPAFKGMLDRALNAQREGEFTTRQDGERWIRQRFAAPAR